MNFTCVYCSDTKYF